MQSGAGIAGINGAPLEREPPQYKPATAKQQKMRQNGPQHVHSPPICAWLDGQLRIALAALALLIGSASAHAQSVDLIRSYQALEAAKADHRVADALAAGDQAVSLLTAQGGDPHELVELLSGLGDIAAQAGLDRQAMQYYQRALDLQSSRLGPMHPDLVPLLDALADLHARAARYTQAAALLQRVLQLQRATYGEHHSCVLATLQKLRTVYLAANDSEAAAQIERQLALAAAARRGLVTVNGKVVVRSDRYRFNKDGYTTVRVFYGTNRTPARDATLAPYYGRTVGDLQYGYLNVTIPQIHQLAELETPAPWVDYSFGVESAENKKKYVVLEKVMPLSKLEFTQALDKQIKDAPSKDVLIFVHGYNNTFEDAARRTAQLAYDMDFDGTPIMYSWPSQGSVSAYAADENVTDVSALTLVEFLQTVVAQSGATHVHLLAHSMGNRVLLGALGPFLQAREPAARQQVFGQIVFTAPDVDRSYFTIVAESLRGSAQRLTLYASESDYALRMSQMVHEAPRAGSAGNTIIRLRGLDTIDMSGVPADALGHSYFAANGGAVYDLLHMIWRDDDPGSPQRCGKSGDASNAPVVWRFDVEKCKGDVILEAAVLLKQNQNLAQEQLISLLKAQVSAFADQKQGQDLLRDVMQLLGIAQPAAAVAK
jgi:esterase/lipase superfamily enzyme